MSILKNCSIKFYTKGSGKGAETPVTITVRDENEVVAAFARDDFGPFDISSLYAFSDPLTQNSRFFYGHLYDCRVETPSSCPYAMAINGAFYCNHPQGHNNCRG
jgi:hypothetical protein